MQSIEQQLPAVSDDLWSYVEQTRPQIEATLERFLPLAPVSIGTRFNEALRWSLFPGGKRLRPVLTLLGAEIVGGRGGDVLPAAAAVEFIHTSSLIFDDLPCMDNSAERRGRAALHQRFGEGLAVLVALALMNGSYGLLFQNDRTMDEAAIMAHKEFVECIGTGGMVVGQTVDLAARNESSASVQVRNLKTSALMRMALRTGAILAGGSSRELDVLSRVAILIGDAYQLRDDVLDSVEDRHLAASAQRRQTLAVASGSEDTMRRVRLMVGDAKEILADCFGASPAAQHLSQMADYIATRAS